MILAGIYARTIFEVAQEQKFKKEDRDRLEAEMDAILEALEKSKELKVALFSPATSRKEKVAIIEALSSKMDVSDLLTRFLVLLGRKERFNLLPEIRQVIREFCLDLEGGVIGLLESAERLEPGEAEEVEKVLSKKLGKHVMLRTAVDPTLVAGMRVTVKGITYDATLRWHLQELKDQLVHGVEMAKLD